MNADTSSTPPAPAAGGTRSPALRRLRRACDFVYLAVGLGMSGLIVFTADVGGQSVPVAAALAAASVAAMLYAALAHRDTLSGRLLTGVALATQVMTLIFASSNMSAAFVEEAHFSYFVLNAFLLGYLCIPTVLVYNALVVLHHVALTFLRPELVWAAEAADDAMTHLIVHAGVAAVTVVPLVVSCRLARRWILQSEQAVADATAARRQAQREAESARRADMGSRAKSEFLGMMSHELRTPLNGVLGMTTLLRLDGLGSDAERKLDVIADCGEHLLAILNDVLDMARIESGALSVDPRRFEIGEVVRGAAAAFRVKAEEKGLALSVDISEAAAGAYVGDPTRIGQILRNLIDNAVKFTEAGRVTLSVDRIGGALRFSVADTGPGVPEAAMGALFETFSQTDGSSTRAHGGLGLGLALSQRLAELMGGVILAESVEGRGATFTLTLSPPRADRGGDEAEAPRDLAGMRVLCAEDEELNRIVLRGLLDRLGVEARFVEDGVETVAAWGEGAWDAVLMDLRMPRMTGDAACREIRRREREAGASPTPVIALTANAMARHREICEAAGMTGFIAKPVDFQTLILALREARRAGRGERAARDAA